MNAYGVFASDFLRIFIFLWSAHEKRHSGGSLVGPSLTKEVVITQHFSVIESENGQTVFETTGMLDEATNLVIHEIDHAMINSIREQDMSCSEANSPHIGGQVPSEGDQIRVPNRR